MSRRDMAHSMNEEATTLTQEQLVEKYGQLWSTAQLREDYTVIAFAAPFVQVIRKSDGVKGLMMFSHLPRWYHSFVPQ